MTIALKQGYLYADARQRAGHSEHIAKRDDPSALCGIRVADERREQPSRADSVCKHCQKIYDKWWAE